MPNGLVTPVHRLGRLSERLSIDLWVKRDDLYPFSGGGSKARKMAYILRAVMNQGYDAIVTNGGLQSNHARVAALMAAQAGWPCKLILHGEPEALREPRGNLLLMKLAGAEIDVCPPEQMAGRIQDAISDLEKRGFRPLEIPGGGHNHHGALALADAAHEVAKQVGAQGWRPDYVVLASGTGTTQAGLVVGFQTLGWRTHVVGVSVARRHPRGTQVIEAACYELLGHLGSHSLEMPIDFRDDWVGPGYGRVGPGTTPTIVRAARMEGLPLDPTYTGKAFEGLEGLVDRGDIPCGAKVLFWHTGGLLNLMADAGSFGHEGGDQPA